MWCAVESEMQQCTYIRRLRFHTKCTTGEMFLSNWLASPNKTRHCIALCNFIIVTCTNKSLSDNDSIQMITIFFRTHPIWGYISSNAYYTDRCIRGAHQFLSRINYLFRPSSAAHCKFQIVPCFMFIWNSAWPKLFISRRVCPKLIISKKLERCKCQIVPCFMFYVYMEQCLT